MTQVNKLNTSLVQVERWLYEWNPRDQLTKVEKRTGTGSGTYAGKVEYAYCLSCDGGLAHRKEYDTSVSTTIDSWKRYEYDGLKLSRVDERYDTGGGSIGDGDPWRTVEVSTYGPGIVGNLLAKRVYTHTNNDDTPDDTDDYYYGYDHVGNVHLIFDDDGNEVYHFNQDAFGNELNFENYAGDSWATAAAAGIGEHQTGKWIDDFSGLYFFHARWYDSGVGRFVSRSKRSVSKEHPYIFFKNSPNDFADVNGKDAIDIPDGPDPDLFTDPMI
jgi:RHS repeat-associated protein